MPLQLPPTFWHRRGSFFIGQVKNADYALFLPNPLKLQNGISRSHKFKAAVHHGRMLLTPTEELASKTQNGIWIFLLGIYGQHLVFCWDRQLQLLG